MSYEPESPFDSIEGAQEYMRLLGEAVEETRAHVASELAQLATDSRRADALRLVLYKLERLSHHSASSGRLLNDLRTLRRLLVESPAAERRKAG